MYAHTRLCCLLLIEIASFVFLQDTISVHRPGFYAQRFQTFFAERVFKKIPSCKYLFVLQNYVIIYVCAVLEEPS